MRLRLKFSKGEPVRYISHLDLARVFERAIRRAKLPVAMSEGFNPHMKVAYASALSVGVTSDCEYIDIELREEASAEEMTAALKQQLPIGFKLVQYRMIQQISKALMAVVNLADYTITAPVQVSTDAGQLKQLLEQFCIAQSITFVRHSPKGNRTIDLRPLVDMIQVTGCSTEGATFFLRTFITDKGSLKPQELMRVLVERFGLPLAGENPRVHRSALYVQRDGVLLSPLDVTR
jgi:radical SAM-linked protein